jgi:hypothetical protein
MLKQTSRWSGFVVFGLFGKGKRVFIALSNSALTFDASGTLQPYSDRITGNSHFFGETQSDVQINCSRIPVRKLVHKITQSHQYAPRNHVSQHKQPGSKKGKKEKEKETCTRGSSKY